MHVATTEVLAIRERRVRADGDTVLPGKRNGLAHRVRIARVKSAGNVRRRDQRHQLGVLAAALTDVGVEID